MSDYVIGDVQGCYNSLLHLLDYIKFDDNNDCLWFVGDLVNRGEQSLQVLRFLRTLTIKPKITLGNHDLYLLKKIFAPSNEQLHDTLSEVLTADDVEELGHWLRQQYILYISTEFNVVMSHAGMPPMWDLITAQKYAHEVEDSLHGEGFQQYLATMYGDEPNQWHDNLLGFDRLRVITNYFTRMRFVDKQQRLIFTYKGTITQSTAEMTPWFLVPERKFISVDIVFGHWSALQGRCPVPGIYALDTGCYWGGELTALRLQDRKIFAIDSQEII